MRAHLIQAQYSADLGRPSATKQLIRQLCRTPGDQQRCLLQPISTVLESSSFNVVLGTTGGGKSLFLKLVAGEIECTSGEITYCPPPESQTDWLTEPTLAYLGEREPLHEALTVNETLTFACELCNAEGPTAVAALVANLVEALNLRSAAKSYVYELSDGQRLLLAMGVALAAHPRLLVADGITSGLQSFEKSCLVDLLKALCSTRASTVVLAMNHPQQQLIQQANNLLIFAAGYLVYAGPPADCVPWFERTAHFVVRDKQDPIADIIGQLAKSVDSFHTSSVVFRRPAALPATDTRRSQFTVSSANATHDKRTERKRLPNTDEAFFTMLPSADPDDIDGDIEELLEKEIRSKTTGGESKTAASTASKTKSEIKSADGKEIKSTESKEIKLADQKDSKRSTGRTEANGGTNSTWHTVHLNGTSAKPAEQTVAADWHVPSLAAQFAEQYGQSNKPLKTGILTTVRMPSIKNKRPTCCLVWRSLVQRFARTSIRLRSDAVPLIVGLAVCIAVLYTVWPNAHKDQLQSTLQLVNLLMFLVLVSSVMVPHAMAGNWIQHRLSFDRETSYAQYSPLVYVLAHTTWSVIQMTVCGMAFAVVLFHIFLRYGTPSDFVLFAIFIVNHAVAHTAVVETLVFITSSQIRVHCYGMAVAACSLLLSGFIVPISDVRPSISWLSSLSYTQHAFNGLTFLAFPDRDVVDQLFSVPHRPLANIVLASFASAAFTRMIFVLVVFFWKRVLCRSPRLPKWSPRPVLM